MGRNRKKYQRAVKRLFREISKLSKNLTSNFVRWLLRVFLASPQRRWNRVQSGFVLPTTALLLVVVTLVIAALLIRTLNRTEQVMIERREKVIYNAATPAIDRAKSKLEYLFTRDNRLPGGVPSEIRLLDMMLNEGTAETPQLEVSGNDPYTFPDEQRIDLNGGGSDNAWTYRTDSDGDGTDDLTVVYSITWMLPSDAQGASDFNQLRNVTEEAIEERAENLQVRYGPLLSIPSEQCLPPEDVQAVAPIEQGWLRDPVSSAILRKNFQINAFAISDREDGTVATLEMQQERQADRGNKWGAWFRYDLETAPGPEWRWNGAIHTDGSLFAASSRQDRRRFQAYLVSSPASCLYVPDASEVTVAREAGDPETGDPGFQGQVVTGRLADNEFGYGAYFHLHGEPPIAHDAGVANAADEEAVTLDDGSNSIDEGSLEPGNIALDPIAVFTEDKSQYRDETLTAAGIEANGGNWQGFGPDNTLRIRQQAAARPYIDDFYRADDRFGPKPAYTTTDERLRLGGPELGSSSENIPTGNDKLTTLDALADGVSTDPTDLGLDGYWERRAWREGMRVMVGERLELGNDPLPKVTDPNVLDTSLLTTDREHESLQRRALRDNLAAVQATAIYHHTEGTENADQPPIAAVATTVHPGTAETLKRSATFEKLGFQFAVGTDYSGLFGGTFGDTAPTDSEFAVDFFTGRGTNGWEFEIPNGYFSGTELTDAVANLANFAGDPDGAFPPVQDDEIHPYPQLTKWGDFSNLRRALNDGNGSIADESYQHTAALTLGMLAYNISYLNAFDYTNANNQALFDDPADDTALDLDQALQTLSNGNPVDGGPDDGEVIYFPSEEMDGNGNCTAAEALNGGTCNPIDDPIPNITIFPPGVNTITGDGIIRIATTQIPGRPTRPTPEAYLGGLETLLEDDPSNADLQRAVKLAKLIALKEQVKRDRKFGFKASPSGFNAVNSDSYGAAPSTLFGAENAPLGSYRYVVRYIRDDIDLNGDGDVEDTVPIADLPDLSEDPNRNGVLDLALSPDLNGDGQLEEFTQDLNGDGDSEDVGETFAEDLGPLGTPVSEDVGSPDDPETPNQAFNPINEALQDLKNNVVDGKVDETVLGWDVNGDGDADDTEVEEISEDLNGNEEADSSSYGGVTYYPGVTIDVGCDFSDPDNSDASGTGNNFFGFGDPKIEGDLDGSGAIDSLAEQEAAAEAEKRFIRLASAMCSAQPKYSSLYYLFPQDNHDHKAVSVDLDGDGDTDDFDNQPPGEDVNLNDTLDLGEDNDGDDELDENNYIEDDYIQGKNSGAELYQALSDADIAAMALKPKALNDWILPYINSGNNPPSNCPAAAAPNCSSFNLISLDDDPTDNSQQYIRVGFKDTAFYNGREAMNVRALNLDMAMLTDNASGQSNGTINNDTWIAGGDDDEQKAGGIVYAFREDARREDGIARPATSSWDACNTVDSITSSGCLMNAVEGQDPPVSETNSISPKPVDFYPDPDRRPYGFRIINGEDVSRDAGNTVIDYGLTFISDNPAYMQGSFNCHKSPGGSCDDVIEEFEETLSTMNNWGPNEFYRRDDNNTFTEFANAENDSWRYSEFLVDGFTILSDNFCDGSIEDGFITADPNADPSPALRDRLQNLGRHSNNDLTEIYGCREIGNNNPAQYTSYLNQNRPNTAVNPTLSGTGTWSSPASDIRPDGGWLREDPLDPASPIRISQNANPILATGEDYSDSYLAFDEGRSAIFGLIRKPLINANDDNRINAVIVSGIIPSRPGNSYGGLHNFPRFLEEWLDPFPGKNLYLSGSFLQLNFSTYATGLFDQDAWEPGTDPEVSLDETLTYYNAPQRNWGYDVALQYAQPGPISVRLVTVGGTRSEYYKELPIDDPYVTNLRCAENPETGEQVDPRAENCP